MESGKINASVLCPVRINDEGGLEVLLTRRNFKSFYDRASGQVMEDPQKDMRFPGEWVFAGGKYDLEDGYSLRTALREFEEEMNYRGNYPWTRLVESSIPGASDLPDEDITMDFYLAKLADEDPDFNYSNPNSKGVERAEVIDHEWVSPGRVAEFLDSPEFTAQLEKELLEYGITQREKSVRTIAALRYMAANEEHIKEKYQFWEDFFEKK